MVLKLRAEALILLMHSYLTCSWIWFVFLTLLPRMPGERLTVRGTADVGRFPGAAPPTRVELSIGKEDKDQSEGGCRSWFRKLCPCCCKRQNSNTYDVTDKVELVKVPTPTPSAITAPEPTKPKAENGEAKEMEGKVTDLCDCFELIQDTSELWNKIKCIKVDRFTPTDVLESVLGSHLMWFGTI